MIVCQNRQHTKINGCELVLELKRTEKHESCKAVEGNLGGGRSSLDDIESPLEVYVGR